MPWLLIEGTIEITLQVTVLCRLIGFALLSKSISINHDIYTIKSPGYLKDSHLVFWDPIFQAENKFHLFPFHNIFF